MADHIQLFFALIGFPAGYVALCMRMYRAGIAHAPYISFLFHFAVAGTMCLFFLSGGGPAWWLLCGLPLYFLIICAWISAPWLIYRWVMHPTERTLYHSASVTAATLWFVLFVMAIGFSGNH
jgi:hypothetical protein